MIVRCMSSIIAAAALWPALSPRLRQSRSQHHRCEQHRRTRLCADRCHSCRLGRGSNPCMEAQGTDRIVAPWRRRRGGETAAGRTSTQTLAPCPPQPCRAQLSVCKSDRETCVRGKGTCGVKAGSTVGRSGRHLREACPLPRPLPALPLRCSSACISDAFWNPTPPPVTPPRPAYEGREPSHELQGAKRGWESRNSVHAARQELDN